MSIVKAITVLFLLNLLFIGGCDADVEVNVVHVTQMATKPGHQLSVVGLPTEKADVPAEPMAAGKSISSDIERNFVSTAIPTSTPRMARDAAVNLRPVAMSNWVTPIAISNIAGVYGHKEINIDYEIYLSWAVINDTMDDLMDPFVVDLYLDNVLIERWQSEGLRAQEYIAVYDWLGLGEHARLKTGDYSLRLKVDSTNLISETNELDNIAEENFYFSSDSQANMTEFEDKRFPDLVPYTPNGWNDAMIVSSYSGDVLDGPLSVSVPTYIKFGILNQGSISIDTSFWVYVFLDDVLVSRRLVEDILSGESIKSDEISVLMDIMTVVPGAHTLRLEIDPTDIVIESNEENNVLEKEFTWLVGPVAPKPIENENYVSVTPLPTPMELPNLKPGWRMDWDGPIVVSSKKDSHLDDLISQNGIVFVDVTMHNNSTVPVNTPFSLGLYLDDRLLNTFSIPEGIGPNEFLWFEDWTIDLHATGVTVGKHKMHIDLDMHDSVLESNEKDNAFSRDIFVYDSETNKKSHVKYTENQLKAKLSSLTGFLYTEPINLNSIGQNHVTQILDIVDAGYYMLTGTSIRDERLNIAVLSRKDFNLKIDQIYVDRFAISPASQYSEILAERERFKAKGTGFKTDVEGRATILVNGEQSAVKVISILAHELGHFKQGVMNPKQNFVDDFNMDAIQEAQAQQFERAFWLQVEDFSDATFISYPYHKSFTDLIEERLKIWEEGKQRDPHLMGALLQWLVILDDPSLEFLSSVLRDKGKLGALDSMMLFEYLVELPLGDDCFGSEMDVQVNKLEEYVNARIESLAHNVDFILENARNRLDDKLSVQYEGPSGLRIVGLLMP